VPALNAALAFALQRDFSHILFLSLEMDLTPPAFRALFANFDPADDLVVGAGTCLERDDGEGRESTLKLAASYQLISSPLYPSFPLPYKTSLGRPPFPTWPSPLDRYHYPLEHLRALVRPQVEPFGLLGRLGRAHAGQGSRGRGGGGCHCLSPAMLATASFGVVDVEFFVSME
jgi:hypothetical protein